MEYCTPSWRTNVHHCKSLMQISRENYPDSKVHGADMGPTWVLSAPDGPHIGPNEPCYRGSYYCIACEYQSVYRKMYGCHFFNIQLFIELHLIKIASFQCIICIFSRFCGIAFCHWHVMQPELSFCLCNIFILWQKSNTIWYTLDQRNLATIKIRSIMCYQLLLIRYMRYKLLSIAKCGCINTYGMVFKLYRSAAFTTTPFGLFHQGCEWT